MNAQLDFLLARLTDDECYIPKYHDAMCEWARRGDRGATRDDCDCMLDLRRTFAIAELEARRNIANLMGYILESWSAAHGGPGRLMWPDVNRRERSHAHAVLDNLTKPYAYHADYREDWV